MDAIPDIKQLHKVFQRAKFQDLDRGEVFQTSDDKESISMIIAGFVKRYFIAHSGNLGVQVIYGQGDVFPLTMAFKVLFDQDIYQGPETYYYEAMTQVKLFTISGDALVREVEARPLLYRDLLQNAGIRLHSNTHFLENLRLHGAYAKTAHQLVYFGGRFGQVSDSGIKISLPLTHQDIADIIGTTRETVTSSIIKLRDKKLIKTDRHIIILDVEGLTVEAYS